MKLQLKIQLITLLTLIQSAAYSIVFTTTEVGGNSSKDLTVQAGTQYQLKFDLQHQTTSTVRIQIIENSVTIVDVSNLTDGTHTFSFTPTSGTVTLKFVREDADNVSRDFEVNNLLYEEIAKVTQVESNHELGRKEYELSDHLGNVRVMVSDKTKNGNAEVISATDYLPFGMAARSYNNGNKVRFGYNGKEKENEISEGDYDFGARIYSDKLGHWLSCDALKHKYPAFSPYSAMANNPVIFVDMDGNVFTIFIAVQELNTTTNKMESVNYKVTFNGTTTTMQQVMKDGDKTTYGTAKDYTAGTNTLVDNVVKSYNYIVSNGADVDNAMEKIATSTAVEIEVVESKKGAEYKNGKIMYDFKYGLEVFDGNTSLGVQSPALGFWSEVYHAYEEKILKKSGDSEQAKEDLVHLVKEPMVIDKLKQKDATNSEAKRKTYNLSGGDAWPVKTKGVTSTEKVK